MKRLFAVLLSLILLFSLTGAASSVLAENSGITTDALFSLGTIDGDVYENPYLGYGCRLEGWTYADSDYIAMVNNLSRSMLSSDVQEMLQKASTYIEMLATSPDNLSTITIQYQNIASTYGPGFKNVPVETLIDAALPTMPSVFEQNGFKDVKAEAATVLVGGDEHPGIVITSTYYGMANYQKEACIRTDDYVIFICATSFLEDRTDQLLSYFYPLAQDADIAA